MKKAALSGGFFNDIPPHGREYIAFGAVWPMATFINVTLCVTPLPHRPGGAYQLFFPATCAPEKTTAKGVAIGGDMGPLQ